jgi:hypothetical protein
MANTTHHLPTYKIMNNHCKPPKHGRFCSDSDSVSDSGAVFVSPLVSPVKRFVVYAFHAFPVLCKRISSRPPGGSGGGLATFCFCFYFCFYFCFGFNITFNFFYPAGYAAR